ncbi:Calcineurin-like phosphoesterase [Aerococcus urinaehominis]|uniref:metallophosphoesterase n=1 Tax=Aerococcus urinaehominis TaxID=128944 RepID=UPI00088EF043|nr:metallophosphoesterase [Aerococcus urinaehominis]SDM42621.1 Calcineurin-like phosphoesterase [Aerococcus urinaehominis]
MKKRLLASTSAAILLAFMTNQVQAAEPVTDATKDQTTDQGAAPTNDLVTETEPVNETANDQVALASQAHQDLGKIPMRIQKGNRYEAQAEVTNASDQDAQITFGVGHAGNPNHLIWQVEAQVPARTSQVVTGVGVPNDSSNDTHLFLFNQSNQDLKINPATGLIAEKPYTAEEIAAKEAALYAQLPKPSQDLRVLPYIQSPTANSVVLNWISEFDQPGQVDLYLGQDLVASQTSSVQYLDLAEYTPKEIEETISFKPGNGKTLTLPQGSWLNSNSNYKNTVNFTGLKADTQYSYQVTVGDTVYRNHFKTFPTSEDWSHLRLIAFSDTETEPKGALENREWELHTVTPYVAGSEERPGEGSAYHQKFGNQNRNGGFLVRYPLSQQTALNENLKHIEAASPDALLIAGDLTQGAGYQPAWDEFFRHFAGEFTDIASGTPILPALGNWETYAAINGGYGTPDDPTPAVISRNKYHDYFTTPGDINNPQYKDSYYRTDIGPVTILTLDSTKGIPDEKVGAYTTGKSYSGDDKILQPDTWVAGQDPYMTTDTQGSFTLADYNKGYQSLYPNSPAGETDMPTFNPGTAQWNWVVDQLNDARSKGQIILVKFHHAPYSSGVHGTPPNHTHPDNQSGVAMRVFSPLFEAYGVAAVIAGHDEMFERSWIDSDQNGLGFQVFDVGVAADGLRGEKMVKDENGNYVPLKYNSHTAWSATANEPELWQTNENGVKHLIDGGLHYGHLQMDLVKTDYGSKLIFQPVYIFPVLDDNYDLVRTERRVYNDVTVMHFDHEGRQILAESLPQPGGQDPQAGQNQSHTPGQSDQLVGSQEDTTKPTVDQSTPSGSESTPSDKTDKDQNNPQQPGSDQIAGDSAQADQTGQLADPVLSQPGQEQAVNPGQVADQQPVADQANGQTQDPASAGGRTASQQATKPAVTSSQAKASQAASTAKQVAASGQAALPVTGSVAGLGATSLSLVLLAAGSCLVMRKKQD